MRRRTSDVSVKVAGLVLAAGMSQRAGNVNKLLQVYEGISLVQHAVNALVDSRVNSTLIVLGHDASLVEQAVSNSVVAVSLNKDYALGQSTSLVHGVSLLYEFDAVVVCLGDMPHITTDVINALIYSMQRNPEKSFFVPVFNEHRGNPVLITKERFNSVMNLKGDEGARSLMRKEPEAVMEVLVASEGVLIDYDTPEALEMLPAGDNGPDTGAQ